MKNISRFIKGQMTVLLLMLFPLLTGLAGCQKDKTHELDITKFHWELNSITKNGEKHEKPNEDFHRSNAYILWFSSASTFMLNTSVNYAGGYYKIESK